jgi:mannose-6-phosphate isomerase-like protein (cupin superfamily)
VSEGYEVAHIDELEALPVAGGEFVWRPVRRRFGITAFGTNAYTAERAGQRVIEEHKETGGHEELYVVLRGRARFTLDGKEVEAPAGTLVYVRPGTQRGAIAAENGTAVLAVGAKPGAVFEPSPWEDSFAAYSYAESGDVARGRALMHEAIERHPDAWQGYYNLACLEARWGDADTALGQLERAAAVDAEAVRKVAADDPDFAELRTDPRFSAVAGEPQPGGAGA